MDKIALLNYKYSSWAEKHLGRDLINRYNIKILDPRGPGRREAGEALRTAMEQVKNFNIGGNNRK